MTPQLATIESLAVATTLTQPGARPEDFADLFAEQPELTRLLLTLKRARGFALYFARCNVPAYRQKLMEALAATLPRPIVQVALQPMPEQQDPFARATLDAYVSDAVREAAPDAAIFITGLEHYLPSNNERVMMATLQEINWRRSAFQRLERPVVFWLPEYALTATARNAPDLYDWYSGVYELDVPQRISSEVSRSTLSEIQQTQDIRWLSQDERHRWAEVLHELLAQSQATRDGISDVTTQADLLNQLGRFYREQAQYHIARNYLEKALKTAEAAFGPNHPYVAARLNNLASVLQDLGELAQARSLFKRALKINEAAFGPNHPDITTNLNNLAGLLQSLGELAQARSLFERALKIDEAAFGPDHPNVAIRLNNLALVLEDLGELIQARSLFERSLKIAEDSFGIDHPNVATGLNNLANLLRSLGELTQARSLFERSLQIAEAAFGVDHPNVAMSLNNLALVLQDLGELAQAHSLFEQSLKIYEAAFGPDHPTVATGLNNLAMLINDAGESVKARSLFERALNILQKNFGDQHPNTKSVADNLAALDSAEPNNNVTPQPGSPGFPRSGN